MILADTQLALGANDEAIKAVRAALALAPEDARAYTLMGNAHVAKGDLRAGQEAFTRAIEVDPAFTPGRVALGKVYDLGKKPEDALREYDAALAQDPRAQVAVTAKVATLVQQKRLDDAVAAARAAAEADPKAPRHTSCSAGSTRARTIRLRRRRSSTGRCSSTRGSCRPG